MSEITELTKEYMKQGVEIDSNLFAITKILEKRIVALEARVKALEAGKEK